MNHIATASGSLEAGTPGAWASAMGAVSGRLGLLRVRRLAGSAIFVAGTLHSLSQALALLPRGV